LLIHKHVEVVVKDAIPGGAAVAETKPLSPGTYYGELSPGCQWRWNGTGLPGDQWEPSGLKEFNEQSRAPEQQIMSGEPELSPCPICGEPHIDKSKGCALAHLQARVEQIERDLYEEVGPQDEQDSQEGEGQQQFKEEPQQQS
jgi:hypothetical protein